MKTRKPTAIAVTLLLAACTLAVSLGRSARAESDSDAASGTSGPKNETKPVTINGERFLLINMAQLSDGRKANSMPVFGDWVTFTTRDDGFISVDMDHKSYHLPKSPEIISSLNIEQIYYVPTGDFVLSGFDGHDFTQCVPATKGMDQNNIKFPPTDVFKRPESSDPQHPSDQPIIDAHHIGFKTPKECGALIYAMLVRAPEAWSGKESLRDLLTAAGNRLAMNLQKARDLLFEVQDQLPHDPIPKNAKGKKNQLLTTLEPFHHAVDDCLDKLGVDATELPKSSNRFKRFFFHVMDYVEGKSTKPRKPVTDPAVIESMTKVYLYTNFLISYLTDPEVEVSALQPSIDQLQRVSDDLNRSLGFNRGDHGHSKSYYAVMDNTVWILKQLLDDRPYVGLTANESDYLSKMIDLSTEIRTEAIKNNDSVAAGLVDSQFSLAWSGPKSETFRAVLTKLFRLQSAQAVTLQTAVRHLSQALISKCGSTDACYDKYSLQGAQ